MNPAENFGRRVFLKHSFKVSAGLILAFNYGCSIKEALPETKDTRINLLYATRYGATRDTAEWIAKGIGPRVSLIDLERADFEALLKDDALLILGSGVWIGGVHSKLKQFVTQYADPLREKVIGSFVVCGSQDNSEADRRRIAGYLSQINAPLGYQPRFTGHFGGRLVIEKLSRPDREALTQFYRKYLKKELESWDRTDPLIASDFGISIRQTLKERQTAL